MAVRRGHVWFGTRRVGSLRADDGGRLRFAYDADWLEHGFAVSITLPLDAGAAEVDAHAYFEGLLPEGRARRRISRQLKLRVDDDVGLLFAIGRDCAGALIVLAEDERPTQRREARIALDQDALHALVLSRGTSAPSVGARRRFSLAGAQDKFAVIAERGKLWLPNAADPSTHILKFETLPWVCFAEYMGSQLARRVGLEACDTVYLQADTDPAMPYLRLTRYDRSGSGRSRTRVHQEDVAQALGYPSDSKYEQDGGPTLAQVAELLRRHVYNPIEDLTRLRDWQLFNYLIGNSDGHAKNLALLYDSGEGVPRLAPFYDLVCIEFHNRIGAADFDRGMAFFVGQRSEPEEIRRADWEALARAMHVSPPGLLERLAELTDVLPDHAARIRAAFAERFEDNQVYDRCVETITDRCRWVQNNVLRR